MGYGYASVASVACACFKGDGLECVQGLTKETFPGFVKIWWLCFPLCLRLAG